MKKVVLFYIMITFLLGASICQASDVPLNDNITIQQFTNEFHNRTAIENMPRTLVQLSEEHNNDKNLDIYHYKPINVNGLESNVHIVAQCYPDGTLYEIDVWDKLNSGADFYDGIKIIAMYAMIFERVFGMPGGEFHTDGLLAILDANKKGKGSYWCSETSRRYTVEKISSPQNGSIGYMFYATI